MEEKITIVTQKMRDKIPFLFRGRGNKEVGETIGYVQDIREVTDLMDKFRIVAWITPQDTEDGKSYFYELDKVDPCYAIDEEGNYIFRNDIIEVWEKDAYCDKPRLYFLAVVVGQDETGMHIKALPGRNISKSNNAIEYYDWSEFENCPDSDFYYYFVKHVPKGKR